MSDKFQIQFIATADDVECGRKELEGSVSWTIGERIRCYWLRLRLTVAEMNYASRRLAELQAPWINDSAKASRSPRQS